MRVPPSHSISCLSLAVALGALCLLFAPGAAVAQTQIVVASDPPGASIAVDGHDVGTAPTVATELAPGSHLLSARWSDGVTSSGVVSVEAGRSVTVIATPVAISAPTSDSPSRGLDAQPPGAGAVDVTLTTTRATPLHL